MKTINTPRNLIPATLASISTLPRRADKPLNISPERKLNENPCKTLWQQKWLKLEVVHPLVQVLADAVQAYCHRWYFYELEKTLLVIVGDFGSGKTHAAKGVFRFALAASMAAFETNKWPRARFPQSLYLAWPECANEFNDRNFSVMHDAFDNELLIIDDIGAENDPWKLCADRLCQILSRRERMFTVSTTNVQPAQWSERFDGRINDRLLRNSVVVDLTGVPSFALR